MATRKLKLGQVNGGRTHVLERTEDDTWRSICWRVEERFHDIEIVRGPRKPDCKSCLKVLGRR